MDATHHSFARSALFIFVAIAGVIFFSGDNRSLSAQGRGRAAPPTAAPKDPCAAPANAIIAENCKTGNPSTEWDVNGGGDPSIQGFSTDVSYNAGEKAQFKVLTNSPKYRIDIYRTGYYGGLGARFITTVQPSAQLPQQQPPCKEDWSVRLYDCGTWGVSASWDIPADALSGVYIARLVREDPAPAKWRMDNASGSEAKPQAIPGAYGALGMGKLRNPLKEPRASQIVFVVRNDASKADVVMQTSDEAWATYNQYGLGSSYNGRTAAGEPGNQSLRANKVSLNRVNTNRATGSVNQYFHAEYALVRFLERNGYDVTYLGGIDSDRHGQLLMNHKLYISIGHDEYWSGTQRKNVEAARDAGVNMAFMSGNEVFWKTRFEPSIDGSNTPHRTIAIYKETHTRITDDGELQPCKKIDPMKDVWTGTWRDASPCNPEGAYPENALTGTIFTVNGNRHDPLAVPAKFAKLRFWRNTDVAKLKPGEELVLGNGILGHEWDEDVDNGFRPAGIIHLSETTVSGVPYILDWGSVYDSGTATHNLTLYRAKSGALVFGVGAVQWSWGLDNFHDDPTALAGTRMNRYSQRLSVDPYGPVKEIQQATVNLFADMGVQPKNLEPDLVPATPSLDKTAPLSKVLSPADGKTIASETVAISGTASDRGGAVAAVEVSVDGGHSWHAASGTDQWTYEWHVPVGPGTAKILSRAVDDSVNLEIPERAITVRFTGTAGAPPAISKR